MNIDLLIISQTPISTIFVIILSSNLYFGFIGGLDHCLSVYQITEESHHAVTIENMGRITLEKLKLNRKDEVD